MQPRLFFVNVYESNFRVKDEMFKLSEGTGERPTKNNPPKNTPFSNYTFHFINNICLFFPVGHFQGLFWPDTFVIRRLFFIITSKSTFCQPAATLDINKPFNKGEFLRADPPDGSKVCFVFLQETPRQ